MPTYSQCIHQARKALREKGLPEETASVFMVELTQLDRTDLYLHYDDEIPHEDYEKFTQGMERILKDEPMQYVLGFSWFYGYRFHVDENVLIPRPETEELVANILIEMDEHFADKNQIYTVDIGTGSGAIAISTALEEPRVKMIATDISEGAVQVAKGNAEALGANIDFYVGDMLQPLIDRQIKVDFLICNPPYIPSEEVLENSVKDYEPHVALFGGEDGLKFYRQVFEGAKQVLNDKAIMAFEIGYNQKEALLEEVKKTFDDAEAEVLKDINGKNRMLIVRFIR